MQPGPSTEERKLATVLFADLVGSTELGGRTDPERTRAMLDRFYDAMAAEITRAGGTVEKFVGDAVMAVFGAPAAQEDHAERALHAALAMRRRLADLFGEELRLRIGVNTGDVVVGRPREGSSFVTGDAVNVCARLEQNAAPGEIVVGERTAAAVRGAFEFGEPEVRTAKGKEEGVRCRRLVRALSLMRARGVGGLRATFVGRESEVELLRATVNRTMREREPHIVTIMGDAGVGKSRLVRELWEWLGGLEEEPVRRTGRCLPYGHAITYWPLGEVLKEHFGILESDAPEAARMRIGSSEILGLTLGLEVGADLHPLEARDRLHDAWVEFLQGLAAERLTVVLVEDVHWAEEPLLELLERIVRDVSGPLVLVCTARPELLEARPTWGGGRRNSSLLWLGPLSPDEASRLLDQALGTSLPERLREVVVERSEGNPFFVEELIGTLVDRGLLARTPTGWEARELPADFSIPDSVHAVLAARIDLLPTLEKSALQAASVIGRIFWDGPVRELLADGDPDFSLLEDRDFVRRRSGSSLAGEREYAIKHALTREVAYSTLPKARRARLHAAFADWLERGGDGRDDHAALLAHHYAEAVRPVDADLAWAGEDAELERLRERAVDSMRRAAELAVGRYEVGDAIELLEAALALQPAPEVQALLWRGIGHAHALRFEGEQFWRAMQSSLQVCVDRATCADTYSLLAFHTSVRAGMWKRRPDPELVEGWIQQALELSDPGTPARARALLAQSFWRDDAAAAREASTIADELGDIELRSWALEAESFAVITAGRYDQGWELARLRFDLEPEISDPDHVADIHEGAVPAALAAGELEEARRAAQRLDEHAQRLSGHHRLHGVSLRVEVEEVAGGWQEVRALSPRVEEAVAANLDTPCVRNPLSLLLCAAAWQESGDSERAGQLEQQASELGMEGYDELLVGPRIRLELVRGRLDRVEELVAAFDGSTSGGWPETRIARLDALWALRDHVRLEREAPELVRLGGIVEPFAARALGLVRGDEELVGRALARFEALGLGYHADQLRAALPAGSAGA